jgi:hypothetical protein
VQLAYGRSARATGTTPNGSGASEQCAMMIRVRAAHMAGLGEYANPRTEWVSPCRGELLNAIYRASLIEPKLLEWNAEA